MAIRRRLFSLLNIALIALSAAAISLTTATVQSDPAGAATLVENYPLSHRPVQMAVSGNYAYAVLLDGSISRIDLTGPVDSSSVMNNWAVISPDLPADQVSPAGIVIVGSDLYVASTIYIDATMYREAWVSKIPIAATGVVDEKWWTLSGIAANYLDADALTASSNNLYLSYSDWATDGSPLPATVGVRSIDSANATTVYDWTTDQTASPNIEPSEQIIVANNWVYTRNPATSPGYSQRLMCVQAVSSAVYGSCLDLGNGLSTPSGDIPTALTIDGSTAYVSLENWGTGDSTLQQYSLSGAAFTPSTSYPVVASANSILPSGTTLYLGNYQTISAQTTGSSPTFINNWAILPSGADVNQLAADGSYIYSVNNRDSSISRITVLPDPAVTSTSSTLTGTEGQSFTSSPLTATNFSGTVTYSISPGLPNGLTFDVNTGVISGTPNGALSSTVYTITATGPGSETATVTITLSIAAANGGSGGGGSSNGGSSPASEEASVNAANHNSLASTGSDAASGLGVVFGFFALGAGTLLIRRATVKRRTH